MDETKNVSAAENNITELESNSQKSKTKPEYNIYRWKTRKFSTYADDFVFVRTPSRNINKPIVPIMAGITAASPDYYIVLNNSGFKEKNLVVIEYVVSGSGQITYNGITKKVSAGDFYILSPEFNGSYRPDPEDPFVKKWVNIDGQLTPRLLKGYGIRDQVFKMHFNAEKYIDDIHAELSSYDENDSEKSDIKITHILIDLLSAVNNQLNIQKKEAPINMENIIQYIKENIIHGGPTVEAICNTFYISRRTLDRLFMNEMGLPPIKYITCCRIELTQQMLAEGMSIEEVSNTCGFSSPTYFRKVFSSVCGESPQKYKQRMKNKAKE